MAHAKDKRLARLRTCPQVGGDGPFAWQRPVTPFLCLAALRRALGGSSCEPSSSHRRSAVCGSHHIRCVQRELRHAYAIRLTVVAGAPTTTDTSTSAPTTSGTTSSPTSPSKPSKPTSVSIPTPTVAPAAQGAVNAYIGMGNVLNRWDLDPRTGAERRAAPYVTSSAPQGLHADLPADGAARHLAYRGNPDNPHLKVISATSSAAVLSNCPTPATVEPVRPVQRGDGQAGSRRTGGGPYRKAITVVKRAGAWRVNSIASDRARRPASHELFSGQRSAGSVAFCRIDRPPDHHALCAPRARLSRRPAADATPTSETCGVGVGDPGSPGGPGDPGGDPGGGGGGGVVAAGRTTSATTPIPIMAAIRAHRARPWRRRRIQRRVWPGTTTCSAAS